MLMSTINPQCPICGAQEWKPMVLAENRKLLRCGTCRFALGVDARLAGHGREEIGRHYQETDPREKVQASRRLLQDAILDRLERSGRHGGLLLDIGSNYGHFLARARERGWRVKGVEISTEACRFARVEYRLDVFQGDLLEAGLAAGAFAVVTLIDVIPYLETPRAVAAELYHILEPGGVVVIRTRNLDYQLFLRQVFKTMQMMGIGRDWRDPSVFHPFNYTAGALDRLLRQAGFTVFRLTTSRPTTGDPYGSVGGKGWVNGVKTAQYLGSEMLRWASFGRVIFGPSLELWARKPG